MNNSIAVVGLLVLTALAFEFHELSHHFFGWAVCGRPGSVTFTQFAVAEGCAVWRSRMVELFGPLVSMVLAYGGAWLALKRASLFGFGLTFASYFHLRFLPALMGGGNDEVDIVRQTGWLHGSPYAIAAILFALASTATRGRFCEVCAPKVHARLRKQRYNALVIDAVKA